MKPGLGSPRPSPNADVLRNDLSLLNLPATRERLPSLPPDVANPYAPDYVNPKPRRSSGVKQRKSSSKKDSYEERDDDDEDHKEDREDDRYGNGEDDYEDEEEVEEPEDDGVDKVVEESKAWTGAGENLRQVKLEPDKNHSEAYIDAFRQYKYLAGLLLRFPFEYRHAAGGGNAFEFYWQPCEGIAYVLTSVVLFALTVLYTFNVLSVILNFPQIPKLEGPSGERTTNWHARAEEMYIFYRNSAMVVMFGMLLIHVCVANWKTYRRRTYIATYLSYCSNSLDQLKLPAAEGLASYIFFMNLGIVSFVLVIIGLFSFRLSPITTGGPGFIGVLMVRMAHPGVYQNQSLYWALRIFAQGLLIYLLLASKLYVILFIFQCKVLQGAFHLWNQRLDLVLNRGDHFLVLNDRMGRRTSFRELFQDHTILLDLLDGADMVFGDTIESYYATQVLSMIFEMYWFWRCMVGEEFNNVRKLDSIFILVYLLYSFTFLLLASFSAAAVSEEGMDGLEVLRRKGMFGRKSPEELYFLMSLYVSFSGHYDIAISGGGYSNIDRSFLVGVGGTILSYFIVLIQFSHPLGLNDADPLKLLVQNESVLIRRVENTHIWFTRYDVEAEPLMMMNQSTYPTLFNLTQLI